MSLTLIKAANIYFDGKVSSRTIEFPDGSKKTLGIMMVGDYEFDTHDNELIEIQAGEVEVLLPNQRIYCVNKATGLPVAPFLAPLTHAVPAISKCAQR
jgi:uncharacterized protein YaiE (UPF0345 family)